MTGLATAEWLRGDAAVWAVLAGVAGLAAVALAIRPPAPRPKLSLVAALTSLLLGVVLAAGALRVGRIECCWPALRERLVTSASRSLQTSLGQAIAEARRIAERGATAASLPREAVFDRLGTAIASGPFERGAAVLDERADSTTIAWAGRHRVVPTARDTTELQAVMTPFYAVLEARRQTENATSVGNVLLNATPAIADGGRSLAAEFGRANGVSLRLFPPGQGPRDSSVFEICNPRTPPKQACAPGDTLFSVQMVPPSQGDAKLAAVATTAWFARLGLIVLLAVLLVAAPSSGWRWGVLLVAAWTLFHAPVGPAALFSPATFYRRLLGIGTSAGTLLVAGVLLLVAAGALWRRGVRRTWWGTVAAGLLIVAAPYAVRYVGRGIAPPASGVSLGLWLSWQAALAVAALALILLAAALVRGPREPERVSWALPLAGAWCALAVIGGLWLWNPNGAWPEWYTFLWLPSLVGAIVPAPRRWALVGIAIVGGTAAALLTWGAAVEGRLALATRDAQRLGHEGDPVAVAMLERLGQQATDPSRPLPRSAGDLYALWSGSPLVGEDYPAMLELWGGAPGSDRGAPLLAELQLAQLDVSLRRLSALAAGHADGPCIEPIEAIPGVHYVLVAPLRNGTVLTVAVGPRTRWLAPNRVARFLRGDPGTEPPYTISLSLPTHASVPGDAVLWRREGWTARGERQVDVLGGVRHVHLRVPLGGPSGLLVRGILVVGLDVALLVAVWLFGAVVAEGLRVRLPALLTTLRTSYRAQLTSVLVAFFVLPMLGFAAWSFARLADEARRSGICSFARPCGMRTAARRRSPRIRPTTSRARSRSWGAGSMPSCGCIGAGFWWPRAHRPWRSSDSSIHFSRHRYFARRSKTSSRRRRTRVPPDGGHGSAISSSHRGRRASRRCLPCHSCSTTSACASNKRIWRSRSCWARSSGWWRRSTWRAWPRGGWQNRSPPCAKPRSRSDEGASRRHFRRAHRASSSRCSARSIAWSPTCAEARERSKKHGSGPRACSRTSRPV